MSNFPERNEPDDSHDVLGPRSEPDDKTKLPLIQERRYQGFIDGLPSDAQTNANYSAAGTQQNSAPDLLKPQPSANAKKKARKGKPNNTADNLSQRSHSKPSYREHKYEQVHDRNDSQPSVVRQSHDRPLIELGEMATIGQQASHEHSAKIAQSSLSMKRSKHSRNKPEKGLPEKGDMHQKLLIVQKKNEVNLSSKSYAVQTMEQAIFNKLLNQQNISAALNKHATLSKNKQESTKPEKINALYEENQVHKLHEKLDKSDEYHESIIQKVGLDELYEVVDFLFYNEEQNFCPVLLEIKNEELLDLDQTNDPAHHNDGQNEKSKDDSIEKPKSADDNVEGQIDKKRFLLQIWRRSDGQLLYERKLRLMPKGWGLNKDRFFYQEDDQEDKCYEIHEVRYITEDDDGKEVTPRVHVRKIILPQAIKITQEQHNNQDTEDREGVQNFQLEEGVDRWHQIKDVQKLEESACDSEIQESPHERAARAKQNTNNNSVAPEMFISNCKKTLTEYEENECRRERKIPVNLSFVSNRIIIATPHALIEVNEKEHKKKFETQCQVENEELSSIWNINQVQIKQIAIHGGYFFQQFIDIGLDKSAMLLENPRTNQVRFVLLTSEKEMENGKEKDKVSYEVLGIVQKPPNTEAYGESKIQKVVTVQGKVDVKLGKEEEQRIFIITLILRESGLVEVYSDFELAENFNLAYNKKHLYCVDIQADDESFYFKFLRLAPKNPNDKYEIRKVSYQWRRRITYKNSVEFKISDWDSIRMKNLNQFMRLYTHFEAVQGFFIIAHRNYISVYDLTTPPMVNKDQDGPVNETAGNGTKPDQRVSEKGHWREHVKIHPIHHIRQICLEKDPSIKHLQEGLYDLPTHSVPFRTLHHSFKIRVILNDNTLKKYLLRDQKLQKESEEKVKGQIVYIQQDAKYGTGILVRTLCGTCGMSGEEKKQQEARMMHTPLSLPSPPISKDVILSHGDSVAADEHNLEDQDKDHLVFTDLNADVEQRCTMGSCYKLISINYGQLVQLWPQIESAQDAAREATKVVQQQVKSYAKDLESYKSLETDGDIRVVNISKQFWLDSLPDLDKKSELYMALEDKGEARALLVYKKNDYIKLVPYLQTKQKPNISKILLNANNNEEQTRAEIMQANRRLSLDTHLQSLDKHSDTKFSFKLFPKQTINLLGEDTCSSVLCDQDLLLVRFVQSQQESEEIRINSFVIITKEQISVFDPEKHEIARISGLQVGSAVLLDSMYIYIMEERFGSCFEQYSDKESDWELSEPKEIIRNCSKEEEGCIAINFQALFKQKFSDILVNEAATGHNGQIVRCQTNDVLCMMRNMHIVTVMPIPHWNLLSFTGMRSKSQYLIWKQSADGFFTALSKSGRLNTWSSVTGMQLWSENQNRLYDDVRGQDSSTPDCCWENIHMYEVYRSDKDDNSYLGDYFNYDNANKPEESYSLSLLVSRNPVYKEATMAAIDNRNQENVLRREGKRRGRTKDAFHEPGYDKDVIEALLHQTSADLIGFDEKVQKMSKAGTCALDQAAAEAQFNDHEDLPDEMFQRELDEANQKLGKCRKFTKKMRRMKLYHFQVLRLRQYEDMKRLSDIRKKSGAAITQTDEWWKKNYFWVPREATGSKVEMVYHFFHKLLVKFQDKPEFEKFDWYLDNIRTRQRLYLSKDAEKMCEVIQNRLAVIWKKPDYSTGKTGELITWQLDYKISKFPYIASDVCSLPYFLSDDFHFMCDYDYRQRRLRLLTTKTASLIRTLPQEALHRSDNADERKNVLAALACVKVVGRDKVCTYNQQSGLYTEWPIVQKRDKKGNLRFDENKLPLLDVKTELGTSFMYKNVDIILEFNGKHMLLQPTYGMSKSSVAQRIYYRMSNFKLCMNQRKTIKKAKKGGQVLPYYYPDVYKPLMAIDYGQNISDPVSMFQLDRTFTLLDWKFAELIEKSANFADMEREEQLRLIFSVFPQGNSMLQMFAQTTESEDSSQVGKMASVDDCMQLFHLASQGYNMRIDGEDQFTTFNVPLFPNCHGMQPLDYAMANKSLKKGSFKEGEAGYFNSKFARLSKEEIDIINSSKNLPLVQAIFDQTKGYGFMNTCPVKSIIMAVREQLPQVFDYLNSRLIKSNLIKKVLNTEVKDSYVQHCEAWGNYGLIEVDDFSNPNLTQKDLFEKDEAEEDSDDEFIFYNLLNNGKQPKNKKKGSSQKKKLYDYYWFDVPHIWNRSYYGYQFMQALQINKDISIFQNQSIQIIVVNQWKLWWWRNFSMIMMPMITQLIIFTIYTCFILVNKKNANSTLIVVLEWVSLALAAYFLILEVIKMVGFCRQEHKRTLFKQTVFEMIWELASPITIIVTQLKAQYQDYDTAPDDSYWELIAWTAFIFWVRFILMLRSNEYLSPAISMVFNSFSAMGSYMVIVLLGVFAFCNTFIAIRQPAYDRAGDDLNQPTGRDLMVESWQDFYDKWLTEYVDLFFELFIGAVIGLEGENGAGLTASQNILLIVALVFNTVVLMNLLLAVVGAVQGVVEESRNCFYYRGLVDQICMLQRLFLIPDEEKPKQLLFLTKTRREYEVEENSVDELQAKKHDSVMDNVNEVKSAISDLTKKINKIQQLQKLQHLGVKSGNMPFARITNNRGQANVAEQLKKRQSNVTPKSPNSSSNPAQLKKRLSSINR